MRLNFKYSTLYIYCAFLHNSSIYFLPSIFPTRHIVVLYISPICGNLSETQKVFVVCSSSSSHTQRNITT